MIRVIWQKVMDMPYSSEQLHRKEGMEIQETDIIPLDLHAEDYLGLQEKKRTNEHTHS